jgi:hypothetical protein
MPHGVFRRVIVLGGFAFKLPRLREFARGMRCNRWEREMWYVWRPKYRWENLCPILFADPFGLLVVMARAAQPVTFEEVRAEDPDYYPGITAEAKPEDYGRLNGRIVAVDYGWPDADMVAGRRAYYLRTPALED